MSTWSRVSRWLGRRRRQREWQSKRREFVYLDEVSVTSLVAAREGAISESFTDSLSTTTSTEGGTTIEMSAPGGGPKGGWSSRASASQTTAREVVRRAVIQGTFRSLRLGDTDLRLSIEDQSARARPKPARSPNDLRSAVETLEAQRRATRVRDLARGDVLEVRVDLHTETSYQISAAISSILDLIKDHSEMFGIAEADLAQGEVIAELLRRMLVDLVPITARVTSHQHVAVDGESWLVDRTAIDASSALASETTDFCIAGVTELPGYWKDVRRVLFDGSSYTAYVRISKSGLRDSWSPVKLADVFERIFPDVGAHLRELPRLLSAGQDVTSATEMPTPHEVFRDHGLIPFGFRLAAIAQRSIDAAALGEVASVASQRIASVEDLGDVGPVRSAFAEIVRFVEDGTPIDRDIIRSLRETHQEIARLQFAVVSADRADTVEPPVASTPMLEVEFIAIYW